jgi:bifunctional ADP-heptose synthase (sugar kinase/adenylyltransferase)
MKENAKTVFVSGKFRVIHAGHMRLFRTATDFGSKLIVAIDTDGLSPEEIHWRENLLRNIEYVDQVIEYDGNLEKILKKIQPDIVIKGQEFRDANNIESKILSDYGGKLVFTSGANYYSESDLINSNDSDFVKKLISMPQDFMTRNHITTDNLITILHNFSKLRVCVVGDLIVDEYINCHPLGMSQEEPTVVVTPVDKKRFFGGAGIVAAHCKSLGAETSFVTVTGDDEISTWALNKAAEYNIECFSVTDSNRPTTLKQRYRSGTQTLLKISHLSQNFLDSEKENAVIEKFKVLAPDIDVLIFSDFSYGVLSPNVVNKILSTAHEHNIFVF